MNQLKAGFKKEFILYSRTYRLIAIILIFIGLSIIDPGLILFMNILGEMMQNIEGAAGDANTFNDFMSIAYGDTSTVSSGLRIFISDIASTGFFLTALLFMTVAGGEQKKRATIIPACSGLKTKNYLLPKFIIYPISIFLITVISTIISYVFCTVVFQNNDINFMTALTAGYFNGFYLMFMIVIYLFMGISTSRPGICLFVLLVVSNIIEVILSSVNVSDKYNPFALKYFALFSLDKEYYSDIVTTQNVMITILITFAIMLVAYFLTLFIQNAKKIDNSGNEILI